MSSAEHQGGEHAVEMPVGPDEALAALADAAEVWGAQWRRQGSGGRLEIPVTAGLRHGLLSGSVSTEPAHGSERGTRLRFQVDETQWTLHWRAVIILVFGAFGGISFTLWPFYPALLAIAPIALVLSFAAWFLVASRLRTAGVDQFFELLNEESE